MTGYHLYPATMLRGWFVRWFLLVVSSRDQLKSYRSFVVTVDFCCLVSSFHGISTLVCYQIKIRLYSHDIRSNSLSINEFIRPICLHTVKWFQVLLSNPNNSMVFFHLLVLSYIFSSVTPVSLRSRNHVERSNLLLLIPSVYPMSSGNSFTLSLSFQWQLKKRVVAINFRIQCWKCYEYRYLSRASPNERVYLKFDI